MPGASPIDFSPLDPCVHCGFCLQACPTYIATGDEADSPRGRIVLMRALERGEIPADDPALVQHLDACLGCRGCEPVCPSGVGYGRGLEAARTLLTQKRGLSTQAKLILGVFQNPEIWRPLFTLARALRATKIPKHLSGRGKLGFPMGMLAATTPRAMTPRPTTPRVTEAAGPGAARAQAQATVALFRGCVMDTLFTHVHDATKRTLEANGYTVVEVATQTCCGALHDHAGDRPTAEHLAAQNTKAFTDTETDYIVVNSAGCGALLKDYGHLLPTQEAQAVATKTRDVTELLAQAGPRPGAPLDLNVAYDAPCHLQHAQRVHEAPLQVLQAIPGLTVRQLPGADQCCGSAGIYSMLHPEMSRAVLAAKIATIAAANPQPDLVATGNPGCLMQIGAGLQAAGLQTGVAHPVELLDWSYRKAGYYVPS